MLDNCELSQRNIEREFEMIVLEYVLLVLLLVSAVFIVVAVLLQKSSEDGLSGTIAGGADTFYGKDKSSHTDRALYKWTIIAAVVFMLAVLAVYIIQPDFASSYKLDVWQTDSYLNPTYNYLFN
jgi:preprotein translocase subunit SecG